MYLHEANLTVDRGIQVRNSNYAVVCGNTTYGGNEEAILVTGSNEAHVFGNRCFNGHQDQSVPNNACIIGLVNSDRCLVDSNVATGNHAIDGIIPVHHKYGIGLNNSAGTGPYGASGAGCLNCVVTNNFLSNIAAVGAPPTGNYRNDYDSLPIFCDPADNNFNSGNRVMAKQSASVAGTAGAAAQVIACPGRCAAIGAAGDEFRTCFLAVDSAGAYFGACVTSYGVGSADTLGITGTGAWPANNNVYYALDC